MLDSYLVAMLVHVPGAAQALEHQTHPLLAGLMLHEAQGIPDRVGQADRFDARLPRREPQPS